MKITNPRWDLLTRRERVVLGHMMEGLSAEQIAEVDYVTVCTARSQIRNILWKLGCTSQLQAVALANRRMWSDDQARCEARERALQSAS